MFRSWSAFAMVVAVVLGAVPVVAAPLAVAAGVTAIEADTMTVVGQGSTIYADSTASGGKAIALTGAVTVATTLAVPDSVRVVVRAKARQCLGAPIGRVFVDGVNIGTSPITASSWTDYTATAPIGTFHRRSAGRGGTAAGSGSSTTTPRNAPSSTMSAKNRNW